MVVDECCGGRYRELSFDAARVVGHSNQVSACVVVVLPRCPLSDEILLQPEILISHSTIDIDVRVAF